jgi:hypothetical protein
LLRLYLLFKIEEHHSTIVTAKEEKRGLLPYKEMNQKQSETILVTSVENEGQPLLLHSLFIYKLIINWRSKWKRIKKY